MIVGPWLAGAGKFLAPEILRTLLSDCMTERDGETFCPVRFFGLLFAIAASVAYFDLSYYSIITLHQPFDFVAFGKGVALIWGTVSLAIVGKALTEPRPNAA